MARTVLAVRFKMHTHTHLGENTGWEGDLKESNPEGNNILRRELLVASKPAQTLHHCVPVPCGSRLKQLEGVEFCFFFLFLYCD